MMFLKDGVSIDGMQPEIMIALMVAKDVFAEHGIDLCITSGVEGEHGPRSKHYEGKAVDLRRRDIKTQVIAELILEKLQERLNGSKGNFKGQFDIVLEKTHYHLEFDPS